MNVLSLFDGCSCARVALDRLGIPCTYYASEIDKYAIKISEKNYPDIIQLGDVRNITGEGLPEIDLLIGGSPCQDLSIAGRGGGLNGSRSVLFYEFVRLLKTLRPKYFVLENVASMKKEWKDIVSQELGVEPVMIDSALVSAQSRKRFYWTNFPVEQPEDKRILLKDIIESGVVDRDNMLCLDPNYYKGTNFPQYKKKYRRQIVSEPVQLGFINQNHRGSRVYSLEGKSVTLCASGGGWGMKTGLYKKGDKIRKLSPIECERFQTLPDNYTEGVSNTQRYKMLGNAFTVDVIVHILSFLTAP